MATANRPVIAAVFTCLLLTLGCGVPMPAADITATAVAPRSDQGPVTGSSEETRNLPLSLKNPASVVSDLANESGPQTLPTREALAAGTPAGTATATASPQATASATPSATVTPAPTVSRASITTNTDYTSELLSLLNEQRATRGLSALKPNAALNSAAAKYTAYMGSANFFGHFGPDGSSPASRIVAAGYAGSYRGEALSGGQTSPQAALNALLASPPHAAILLDPSAVDVGLGFASAPGSTYTYYWSVVTGR